MTFTIGNWIFAGIVLLGMIIVDIIIYVTSKDYCEPDEIAKPIAINSAITVFCLALIMCGIAWYNTSTASGMRAVKDNQSNLNNGIDREITITAEDGREIFHYEGKVDIETDHTDNYILFDTQEGKRYIIYYGIQDTVLIKEK